MFARQGPHAVSPLVERLPLVVGEEALEGIATLPEHLADASPGPRVLETFGLGPSLIAVALAAGGVYFVVAPGRTAFGAAELAALALLFAGAVACVGYEIRRRRRRAVLVAAEQRVGVYREGRLEGVLTARDLIASRALEPMPLKGLLALAAVAVAFVGYGLTEEGDVMSRVVALGPGVWLILLVGSFARVAWLCETFHLPGSRAKALLSKLELHRAGIV